MSLDHVLIGLLAGGQRHGYDLRRQYLARFPAAKPVAAAQIYATLDRLVRDGWVEPAAREQAGGPERLTYSLTSTGRSELQRWLDEVEEPSPFIANPLSIKVTIALIAADEQTAQNFLVRQRASHLSRMRVLTRVKTNRTSSLAEILAADYALDHLDADLRWIDTAVDRVSALAKEIHA